MAIRPIKKLRVPQEEEKEQPDALQEANTLPEMVEAARLQEVEAKHVETIETLILAMQGPETQKIWLYGSKKILEHVMMIVSNTTAMGIEPLRKRSNPPLGSIHLLDISANAAITVRSLLYHTLEQARPVEVMGNKFVFQLSSTADINKLEKRVLSRSEGIRVYVPNFDETDYLKMFSRVVERLKQRASGGEGDSAAGVDLGAVEAGLARFVQTAYLVDNSSEGMEVQFYRYLYQVEEASPYALLNPIHLIILLFSTIKRTTLSSVYEEFERRTSMLAHFKRVDRNIVYRRLTDLNELGMIARGYFIHDRVELEEEVLRRNEVYLKVMLERIKKHWR